MAFLKAGTLNPTVAVLLQIGLTSRRVAQEVVAREDLEILTPSGVRAWVRGNRDEPAERWEYLDAAIRPIWIAFISESDAAETQPWALRRAEARIRVRHFSTDQNGNTVKSLQRPAGRRWVSRGGLLFLAETR